MKKETLLENNICPNCWGKQEYAGKIIEVAKDRQIDINNHDNLSTRAFIQEFMSKNVDGIKLRSKDGRLKCPACQMKY